MSYYNGTKETTYEVEWGSGNSQEFMTENEARVFIGNLDDTVAPIKLIKREHSEHWSVEELPV